MKRFLCTVQKKFPDFVSFILDNEMNDKNVTVMLLSAINYLILAIF